MINWAILQVEIFADVCSIRKRSCRETYHPTHLVIDRYSISISQHCELTMFTFSNQTNLLQYVQI